jgi:hypothetical protein
MSATAAASSSKGYVGFTTDIQCDGDEKVIITATWLGAKTEDEFQHIHADLQRTLGSIPAIRMRFVDTKLIQMGRVGARWCVPLDHEVDDLLQKFHRSHYFHEDGEDEERKFRVRFHVTVGKGISGERLLKSPTDFVCQTAFVKSKGATPIRIVTLRPPAIEATDLLSASCARKQKEPSFYVKYLFRSACCRRCSKDKKAL